MDKRYKPLDRSTQLQQRFDLRKHIEADPRIPISEAVRLIRNTLRLTIPDMSKVTRVAQRTIRNIESGKANPSMQTLEQMLQPFGYRLGIVPITPSDTDENPPGNP